MTNLERFARKLSAHGADPRIQERLREVGHKCSTVAIWRLRAGERKASPAMALAISRAFPEIRLEEIPVSPATRRLLRSLSAQAPTSDDPAGAAA